VERLQVARLDRDALAGILRDALRSNELADEVLPEIEAACAGNPFFAFEILRDLEETGALRRRDDGVRFATRRLAGIRVPATVREVLRRRLAALPPADRAVLDVAACCGFRFDPVLVAHAMGSDLIPTMQRLGRLERTHRLVRAVGRSFVFEHQLVHETLLESLDHVVRRAYHEALGRSLEDNGTTTDSAYDLCMHFLAGGRADRALAHLDEALGHLEANFLNDDAIRLVDRFLGEPGLVTGARRVDLLVRKAVRLNLVGRPDDERGALREALDEVRPLDDPNRRGRVLLELGWHLRGVCRYREARHALRGARRAAREAGDEQLAARAAGMLGSVCFELGHLEAARRCHERRERICRRIGDRRGEASALGNLGIVLWALGRHAESEALFRRQLELSVRIGDRLGEAAATGNLGNVHHARGDMAEARRFSERHLALCAETGNRLGEIHATSSLGNVCFGEGRFTDALDYHRRAAELSAEMGNAASEEIATDNLGSDCAALGRYTEAERHHARALALARGIGDQLGEARAAHNLGVVSTVLGHTAAAERHLHRAADLAHAHGAKPLEAAALRALAGVEARRGEWDTAERHEIEALDLARSVDPAGEQAALAHLALGDLLAERGHTDASLPHLRQAVAIAREKAVPLVRALAAARLALLGELDPATAEAELHETEDRLEVRWALRAHGFLWRATGDPRHRDAARALLDRTPADCRTALSEQDDLRRALMT
jgi:tetratricopeptide (TPR) repeat protein